MKFIIHIDDFDEPLRRGEVIAEFRINCKLNKVDKAEIRKKLWEIEDYLQKKESKNLERIILNLQGCKIVLALQN